MGIVLNLPAMISSAFVSKTNEIAHRGKGKRPIAHSHFIVREFFNRGM
jgi:hypothetical protein